jgi:hypothetical protein
VSLKNRFENNLFNPCFFLELFYKALGRGVMCMWILKNLINAMNLELLE